MNDTKYQYNDLLIAAFQKSQQTKKAFAEKLNIPKRTIEDWLYKKSKLSSIAWEGIKTKLGKGDHCYLR